MRIATRIAAIVSLPLCVIALGVYGFFQWEQGRLKRSFPGMAEYKAELAAGEIKRTAQGVTFVRASP